MDDDLLRMLMTGLYKSSTITHLDVSHNKITNHGVRLLAKLLGSKTELLLKLMKGWLDSLADSGC